MKIIRLAASNIRLAFEVAFIRLQNWFLAREVKKLARIEKALRRELFK